MSKGSEKNLKLTTAEDIEIFKALLMAKKDECPVSWSSNVMFSYDETKTTYNYKLKDTDIYESTGFSAPHIMHIIRAMLDKYEIDRSDFVYSARVSSSK